MYQQPPYPPDQPSWQQPVTQYPPQQPYYQQQYPSPPGYYPPPVVIQTPELKRSLWWLWLILGVIVALIGMCTCGYVIASSQHHTSTIAQMQPTPVQQTGTWTTVQTFKGDGQKKTGVFNVPNDWRIVWSCQGLSDGTGVDGVMYVTVMNSDGTTLDDNAVGATCFYGKTTTDNTEEHQGGNVYLDVNTSLKWTIEVQVLQ